MSMLKIFRSRLFLGSLVGLLGSAFFVIPAFAQGNEDDCGGWGKKFAEDQSGIHNKRLADLEGDQGIVNDWRRPHQNRLTQFGRIQVTKEVCARLDLERDLIILSRMATVLALSLLVLTGVWGGLVWMLEGMGVAQQGRARTLIMNSFIGAVVVACAFVIWQSVISEGFGVLTLELGEMNPIGVQIRY